MHRHVLNVDEVPVVFVNAAFVSLSTNYQMVARVEEISHIYLLVNTLAHWLAAEP